MLGTLVTGRGDGATPPLELDCGLCTPGIDACPPARSTSQACSTRPRVFSYWTQSPGPFRGLPGGARPTRLRLRHLPGRLSVEPRHREAARGGGPARRRRAARLARGVAGGGRRRAQAAYDRLFVPRNDGRYLRRNALVALGNTGSEEHLGRCSTAAPRATTTCSPSTHAGRSTAWPSARRARTLLGRSSHAAELLGQHGCTRGDALPDVLRLEHDRLAAVEEDLADQPLGPPTGVSARAAPSTSGPASPRSTRHLATTGEYQTRTRLASRSSRGSKPSRGSNASSVREALRMRSSRKLRSPSLVRSQAWTYQCGSRRSSSYGSTTRVDGVSSPPSGTRCARGGGCGWPR